MSDDQVAKTVLAVALTAHVAALFWLMGSRNRLGPLLSVNIAVSACILAYQAQRLRYILAAPLDQGILGLIAFEILVLAATTCAFRRGRLPIVASYLAFAVHACASIAAMVFMLTFRVTRLF